MYFLCTSKHSAITIAAKLLIGFVHKGFALLTPAIWVFENDGVGLDRLCVLTRSFVISINSRLLTREVETYQNKLELKTKESRPTDEAPKESKVCELCHKTKFADGVGKPCKFCKRHVCTRCGDDVSFPSKKQVGLSTRRTIKLCKNVP